MRGGPLDSRGVCPGASRAGARVNPGASPSTRVPALGHVLGRPVLGRRAPKRLRGRSGLQSRVRRRGGVMDRCAGTRGRVRRCCWMRGRPLTRSDRCDHEQGDDRDHRQRPSRREAARSEAEIGAGQARQSRSPTPRHRGNQADGWLEMLGSDGRRCLDGIVKRRRVLAPECVGGGWHPALQFALRRAGARSGSDRYQLLRGPQPVARKPYDVLLVASETAGVFGSSIARLHGFADLSSVLVPVRLRGAVQYNPELAPVCLN